MGRTRNYVISGWLVALSLIACDKDPVDPLRSVRPAPPTELAAAGSSAAKDVATGFAASARSWNEIDLSWPTSPSVSGYQIFRSTTGVPGSYTQVASTPANVGAYANTGLIGSTQYCYEIRSFKTAGRNTTYSAFSTALCVTTLPPPVIAPSETDAVPEATGVRVHWKDNSPDEEGFRVESGSAVTGPWAQVGTAAANATSQLVSAPREQPSCFRVTAFNATGPSLASAPDCTTLPAAPTELSAKAADQQAISLTWTDNSAVEDGYQVWRFDPDAGAWAAFVTLPANAATYRDASVIADRAYTYHVKALKDGGYSDNSNDATAVIPTSPPTAPLDAHASFDFGDYVPHFTVSWTDASTNEEGFRIEYSANGIGGWTTYATTGVDVSYFRTDVLGASGCYRALAFNVLGESTPSNLTCAETGAAPSNLTATTVDYQNIDLAWIDNARFERGYAILISGQSDNCPCFLTELPANTTSFRVGDLESDTQYFFYVVTMYDEFSLYDYSNYSGVFGATSPAPPGLQSVRSFSAGGSLMPVKVPTRLSLPRPSTVKRVPITYPGSRP